MSAISSSDVTLAQLRALVTVVDAGGFTAAAALLGLSQSGVSQAVTGLEDALGTSLLARPRRGAVVPGRAGTGASRPVPTEVGERVLAEARAAISRVDAMRQHVARAAGVETGTLRIASVPSAAARLLPQPLARFRRRHPGVSVVLLEGTDEEVVAWVRARVADVGLAGADAPDLHGLTVAPAATDELLLVVPRTHRFAGAGRVRLAAVRRDPVLLSAGGCEPLVRAAFARARVVPDVGMTVRDLPTLLALVREGLGVTLIPALALPSKIVGLRALGLEPAVHRRLVAVTADGADGLPVLQAFLAEAKYPVAPGPTRRRTTA